MTDIYKDFLLKELEDIKCKLKEKEKQEDVLKEALSQLQINFDKLSQNYQRSKSEIEILSRKCFLFKKERNCYKDFITSYEDEINYNYRDNSQHDRLLSLEKSLSEYRGLVEKLQDVIKREREGSHGECLEHNRRLKEKLNNLSEVNKQLEEEIRLIKLTSKEAESKNLATIADLKSALNLANQKLETMETEMEIKFDQSDFEDAKDMMKLKVIHFKLNPADKLIEENNNHYNQLKEENKRLSTRLELIESGSFQDISRIVQEEINYKNEIESLKAKLSNAEEQHQKILIESKKISKEFREIVYKLTGYKMDIVSQKVYKLSNIYAEDERDFLLFTKNDQGTIQLLENFYSEQLTELIQVYLNQFDSLPAFLASLTLNLFKHRTVIVS